MKGNYLLQGRIRCAACGHAMGAVTFPVQKSGRQYSYYICSAYKNGKECPNHRCVYLGELETLVWDEIVAMYKKTGGTKSPKSKINTTKLNAETKLKKLLARKTALLKWVSEGTIDLTDAEKDLQKISSEVTLAQTIISTPEQPELKSDVTTAQVLNARTFEEKRNIILRMNLIVKVKQLETGEIIYDISPEGNI